MWKSSVREHAAPSRRELGGHLKYAPTLPCTWPNRSITPWRNCLMGNWGGGSHCELMVQLEAEADAPTLSKVFQLENTRTASSGKQAVSGRTGSGQGSPGSLARLLQFWVNSLHWTLALVLRQEWPLWCNYFYQGKEIPSAFNDNMEAILVLQKAYQGLEEKGCSQNCKYTPPWPI